MRNTWITRGTQKPPFGAQVNPEHPFAQGHLLSMLFDGGGAFRWARQEAVSDIAYNDNHAGPEVGPTITVGSAPPRTSIVLNPFDAVGASWTHNQEGKAFWLGNGFANIDLQDSSFIPTKNVTICVIARPVSNNFDGFGGALLFSAGAATAAKHCYAYVPKISDGTIYWYFGGTGGANLLSVAGQSFPFTPDRWIFHAGDQGSAIWRNGVKLASQSTAISRTATTAAETLVLNGISANNEGKDREFNLFHMVDRQWSDEMCRWWSAEPYAHLYSETTTRRWWFLNADAPGANGLIINGASIDFLITTLDRPAVTNGIDTLSCDIASTDGSYAPVLDDEVYFYWQGVKLFGGWVTSAPVSGLTSPGSVGIVTRMTASDFSSVTDRRYITESLPSGTLKAALQAIEPYFTIDGISLDPAQATGPTLEAIEWADKKATDALNELSEKSEGYLWEIDYDKVLRMILPGSEAAPSPIAIDGDLTVETTRAEGYANRAIIRGNSPATPAYGFLGTSANFANLDEVVLGGTTYVFQTVLTNVAGHVLIGATADDSLANLIAAITLGGTPGTDYALATTVNASAEAIPFGSGGMKAIAITAGAGGNSIVVSTTGANAEWHGEGNIPIGTLQLGSDIAATLRAQADDLVEQAAHGLWEVVLPTPPDVTTQAALQEIVDGHIAIHAFSPQIIRYATFTPGVKPNQTETRVVPRRSVNGDFLITAVTLKDVKAQDPAYRLRYEITAIEGDRYQGSFHDTYRKWDGAGTSA